MSGMDEASDEIIELVANYYGKRAKKMQDGLGPSAENMLGALAAITADQLVKVCVSPQNIVQSSRWISGNEVDDLLYKRPDDTLFIVIAAACLSLGMRHDELPSMEAIVRKASEGDNLLVFPSLSVDERFHPRDWPPNAAVRFRAFVKAILDRHKIKGEERAITCAFATSKIVKFACERDLFSDEPYVPLLIALETLAGCSRMTPLEKEID